MCEGSLDQQPRDACSMDVKRVDSAWSGALMAQARRPFIIRHDLARNLGCPDVAPGEPFAVPASAANPSSMAGCDGISASALRDCPFAHAATWHALLSPDGVVGYYDRSKWAVELAPPHDADVPASRARLGDSAASTGPSLRWRPLAGQPWEAADKCTPPRHTCTRDCELEVALGLWERSSPFPAPFDQLDSEAFVYIRGALPTSESEALQRGSIFEELRATACFGSEPFRATLYASRAGSQTNLHADEHSGFLVQVSGYKRTVLFNPKASRALRCRSWGDATAPFSRRSFFDDGVPDEPDWASKQPFVGLGGCEVEVGPGEALFIPKGFFHDVLSRSAESYGAVLRCFD